MSDVVVQPYIVLGHVQSAVLANKVCDAMRRGYVPHGSLVFDPTEGGYLYQAMVLVAPSMGATDDA